MEQLTLKLPNLKAELSARHPVKMCDRQKNGLKDVHSLMLGTYKHVPLNWQRDIANMIKLHSLRKGD